MEPAPFDLWTDSQLPPVAPYEPPRPEPPTRQAHPFATVPGIATPTQSSVLMAAVRTPVRVVAGGLIVVMFALRDRLGGLLAPVLWRPGRSRDAAGDPERGPDSHGADRKSV